MTNILLGIFIFFVTYFGIGYIRHKLKISKNNLPTNNYTKDKDNKNIVSENITNNIYIPSPHFHSGDIVRLKSGGPIMTIKTHRVNGGGWMPTFFTMECVWYDEFGRLHTEIFDQNSLIKIDN